MGVSRLLLGVKADGVRERGMGLEEKGRWMQQDLEAEEG